MTAQITKQAVIHTKKQDKHIAEGFEVNPQKISSKKRKWLPLGNKFRGPLFFEMSIASR